MLWNQKLHEDNIKVEREKIREEREFVAKRESLLSTISALRKFFFYYLSLPDRTLPTEGRMDAEPLDLALALSRLDVFCGLETIEKASQLSQAVTKITHEALKAKLPSEFPNEKIKGIEDSIASNEKLIEKIQEKIDPLLASQSQIDHNDSLREYVIKNIDEKTRLLDEKSFLIKKKWDQTETCRQLVIDNIGLFNKASTEFLLLARKELSFPLDERKYSKIKEQQENSDAASLNSLMKHIHEETANFIEEIESENTAD